MSETVASTPAEKIRLIVGLGNPGSEYAGTRHNVGFEVLDLLATALNLSWEKDRKSKSFIARRGTEIILAKPQTYMNLSGQTVAYLAGFYKVPKDGIMIVYDDVDTLLGKIKFKAKGSSAGHNGIKSIIECLGTDEFPRLKIGIGTGAGRNEMVGHVLGRFSEAELPLIKEAFALGKESVQYAINNDLLSAMNHFNRREKATKRAPEDKV